MNAIPTVYNGTQYRSRLEAKWAAVFRFMGWEFEYEPIDLNGYIPDFVLKWHKPLIVEVKPAMMFAELTDHRERIEKSGWAGDAIIVGATAFGRGDCEGTLCIGQLSQRDWIEGEWGWSQGDLITCSRCGPSLFHPSGTWQCYRCGLSGKVADAAPDFETHWKLAQNVTQWKGAQCG